MRGSLLMKLFELLGDVVGVLCLFGMGYGLFFLAGVLQ